MTDSLTLAYPQSPGDISSSDPTGNNRPGGIARPAHPVVRLLPWAQQLLMPQRAWPFSTGSGVIVAVIDSGVDADHPQLRRPGKVPDQFPCNAVGQLVWVTVTGGGVTSTSNKFFWKSDG